jgi:hypothetical protein
MFARVKVRSGVLVLGGVAAADVSAGQAETKVDPAITHLEAILAALGAGPNGANLVHVRIGGHESLLVKSILFLRRQEAGTRRQKAEGRRQKADGRRQTAEGRRQKAEGRRQTAEGRRQKADGRRQTGMMVFLLSAVCGLRSAV